MPFGKIRNSLIRLTDLLSEKKLSLALAESMTCGLAAHQMASIKGTSEVFKGSIVCYNADVKIKLFKIPAQTIEENSAESKIVTVALARRLELLITADIHAAITGLSSEGGSESKEKPVGTVFFAVRFHKKTFYLKKLFRGSPLTIRKKACSELYDFIYRIVRDNSA